MNKFIWLGLFLGSTLGGMLPSFWGADYFSFSGIIFSVVGGIVGIWFGFKAKQYFE